MKAIRQAIRFPQKDKIEVSERPDPPGAGEVVVQVQASGLCHKHLDVMHSNDGPSAFPLTHGYDYAGEGAAGRAPAVCCALAPLVAVTNRAKAGRTDG